MLTDERRALIRRRIAVDGHATNRQLARELGVSVDTVRRDVAELDALGVLSQVRGGALAAPTAVPVDHDARAERRTQEKAAIADRAAGLVADLRVVLLGGGTTMRELARRWPEGSPTTVITPSIDVAGALAGRPGLDVVLLGGRLLPQARVAVGAETVAAIAGVRADACLLGTCSLDPASGLTLHDREEALVARAMIEAAQETIVLADADKLGGHAPFVVTAPGDIATLVTDRGAPADVVRALRAGGVKVLWA